MSFLIDWLKKKINRRRLERDDLNHEIQELPEEEDDEANETYEEGSSRYRAGMSEWEAAMYRAAWELEKKRNEERKRQDYVV